MKKNVWITLVIMLAIGIEMCVAQPTGGSEEENTVPIAGVQYLIALGAIVGALVLIIFEERKEGRNKGKW